MNPIQPEQSHPSEYPPLAEVRQSLRIKWYRSPIDHARLRELSERSDHQGWIQAGGHALLYVLLALAVVSFWLQQSWFAFFVSLWFLGFVATFFKGTSTHELGHGTVFKTKKWNKFFLHAFSLISWWDPYDYAASHTYHHRFTTHPEADRENVLPLSPSLHPRVLLPLFTLNLFSKPDRNFNKGGFFWAILITARSALGVPHSHTDIPCQEWLKALHEDQPESFRQSMWWSRALLVFHLSVLLLAILTGWWVLPLVLTLPSYIANIGSYLLGTTQHCGLKVNDTDFRKNTRSIKLNPVMRFLYWHMNWHTEHHMYAGVPCYNLKQLAQELQSDMPQPKSVWGAWREMRSVWRRQQAEPGYEFDTPLPGSAGEHIGLKKDAVIDSIGDLAPKHSSLT